MSQKKGGGRPLDARCTQPEVVDYGINRLDYCNIKIPKVARYLFGEMGNIFGLVEIF